MKEVKEETRQTVKMTADEWIEKFKPITNPNPEGNGSWSDTAFETYGQDLDMVQRFAENKPFYVWTLLDDARTILQGYHYVNRLSYFITEVPAEAGIDYDIFDTSN